MKISGAYYDKQYKNNKTSDKGYLKCDLIG